MGYSVVHVDELESSGPAGMVRFVRRELGVQDRVDGEDVPVREGTFMRFDPETMRMPNRRTRWVDDDRCWSTPWKLRAKGAVLDAHD